MEQPVLKALSAHEAEVLDFLVNGGTRAEFAALKGTTRAAVSHSVKDIKAKGYDVPEPVRESPRYREACGMFRAGLTNHQIQERMGISFSRVAKFRRKFKAEEA